MESRKDLLQKQIIEALNAKDTDLYSLLKSQWAHRFGVESLEELENLDLKQLNQKSKNADNHKNDQQQEDLIVSDQSILIEDFDNQEKEIKNVLIESVKDEINESNKIKSYGITNNEVDESKAINSFKENNIKPEIKALIPLPPKPKYSYLRKWLLRK